MSAHMHVQPYQSARKNNEQIEEKGLCFDPLVITDQELQEILKEENALNQDEDESEQEHDPQQKS